MTLHALVRRGVGPLALAMVLTMLALGAFAPVYTDEIGWRLQERAWIDGVDRPIYPNCGPFSLAIPPWFMMPVRAFGAITNLAWSDPLAIRVAGLSCAALWFVLLWGLISAISQKPERAPLFLGAVSLMALGVLPLMLAMSRPEQPLLLTLTAALWLTVAARRAPLDARGVAWRCALLLGLATIALSYHIKGVIYAPLFALAILLVDRKRRHLALRLGAIGALAGLTIAAAHYWTARFLCPGDPILAAKLARENISFLIASGASPATLLGHAANNADLMDYARLTRPGPTFMSDWLPPGVIGAAAAKPWAWLVTRMWKLALILLVGGLAAATVRRLRERRRDGAALPLAAILAVTALGWAALQVNKNAYEAGLILPVLALALVLLASEFLAIPRARPWLAGATALAALAGVASLALLAATFGPPLAARAAQPGYIADQPFSVSAYRYAALRPTVEQAAARCGLRPGQALDGVLLDDVSYFAFAATNRPYYRLGLLQVWSGSIDNPARFLVDHGSAGAVLRCSDLPPAMRSQAIATGPICCLDRSRLLAAARSRAAQVGDAGLSSPGIRR